MFKRILVALILLSAIFQAARGTDRKFVLVIDAGHGGKDTGAPGAFSKEKDINLNVALAFGNYVANNCPDVKVIYTRTTDVFVPLYERAEIANRNKADLFISVHTNALSNGKIARGFETYTLGDGRSQATKTNLEVAKRENSVILLEDNYQQHYVGYDPNSPESNIMFEFMQDKNLSQSVDLAKMMQRNVCSMAARPDKGVHQSNLAVLRLTSMPACLIELGFITTSDEEKLLNDKDSRDRISRGIYNAFVEYKNKYYNGVIVPYKTETAMLPKPQDDMDRQEKEEPQNTQRNKEEEPTEATSTQKKEKKGKDNDTQAVSRQDNDNSDEPVFKIQILASSRKLKQNDTALKGLQGCDYYEENGLTKYTYGASTNYDEIYRMRKQIADKFPQSFIIAFKHGEKTDVNEAIREFRHKRQK